MPNFNFNKIIKTLIITDFLVYSGWGLVMPVFAVFILGSIKGGDAQVAGTAAGIYWVVKSLIQIPIGKFLDRNHGEKDDYWFMVSGTFFASLTPLVLVFASEAWHIYGVQVFYAICMAMVIPSWGGIFTRNADKGREAETWGFESSLLGIGMGVAGILGGFMVKALGFTPLFIAVSVFGILGSLLLLIIRKDISPKGGEVLPIKKIDHVM
ncbi:MAG: MFS transporter [Candidatus Spechtbacterales bacterium]